MRGIEIRNRFFRVFTTGNSSKFFVNRKVKDRLFRYIFSQDKESLLELYNALNKTSYTNSDDLEIVTVDSVVYMSMKNDIAFVLYGIIQMYEHRSSFNPNMPVRFLIYLGQEYDKIITRRKENVYGSKLIKLPTPQCIVFYNGQKDMPEEQILRLSDAFENNNQESSVELTVRMININFGHNMELMEKCRKLYEYSYFVDQIRQNMNKGQKLKEAVDRAVSYCIEKDILSDILEVHRMEVVGMLINEFNERKHWKLVTRAAIEEGLEQGLEQGREQGRLAGLTEGENKKIIVLICKKLKKGKQPELIADEVEEPLDKVKEICSVAARYAPEYDAELVYTELYNRQ